MKTLRRLALSIMLLGALGLTAGTLTACSSNKAGGCGCEAGKCGCSADRNCCDGCRQGTGCTCNR